MTGIVEGLTQAPAFIPAVLLVLGFWQMLLELLPAILAAGGSIAGAAKGQDEVTPQPLPAMWPDLNFAMGRFLSNQFDSSTGEPVPYGVAPYPGQLSPNVNNTILPQVTGNWAPWMAGSQYMADTLYNRNPVGQEDPRLATIAQYGAPSQAGAYVGNMAQFGVPTQGMGNLLTPFLHGQGGPRYQPPPIPTRQVTRRA